MRRLGCNVCGGTTAVCSLVGCSSTSLFCGSLDWHSPSCPITSGKLPSSELRCVLWLICLCVGHLSAVYTTTHHHLCSTEVSHASLPSSTRSVTTSTNIERRSHCPQCQGYQISTIGHELERGEWILPVIATFCRRELLCAHIYTLQRRAFCWRQLMVEVCTESIRVLLGPD